MAWGQKGPVCLNQTHAPIGPPIFKTGAAKRAVASKESGIAGAHQRAVCALPFGETRRVEEVSTRCSLARLITEEVVADRTFVVGDAFKAY